MESLKDKKQIKTQPSDKSDKLLKLSSNVLSTDITKNKYPELSTEDCDLLEDLDRWSLNNLKQKFIDRLNHLKTNNVTKDDLHQKILEMASNYEKKQEDFIQRLRAQI